MHYPLDVEYDELGYIVDWKKTCPFNTDDNSDNYKPRVVRNHLEAHNDFGWGSYDLGDVGAYNYTSMDSLKGVYWKVRQ